MFERQDNSEENGRHHNARWTTENGKGELGDGEGGGREKGRVQQKGQSKRETKLTKKGEISNKLRRMSGSNGIQITNVIRRTTEGGVS